MCCLISCSSFAPSSPISLKPHEISITAALTPLDRHSSTTNGTKAAGTAITAKSSSSGTSLTEVYAFEPDVLCFGVDGKHFAFKLRFNEILKDYEAKFSRLHCSFSRTGVFLGEQIIFVMYADRLCFFVQ